jgi:MFS family permease
MGPDAWRIMFLLGILPAFVALWIRVGVPESAMWEATDQQRRAALDRQKSGAVLAEHEHKLTRFTVVELFADPALRKVTVVVFLMSLTTTLAWWGISTWVPPYIASVAAKAGLTAQQWASYAAMAYNAGAILGYGSFGFLADAFGRKPVVIVFFAMSLVLTPVLFLWTHDLALLLVVAAINGYFTLGQYSWMPVWLPELFPTRIRATGMAFHVQRTPLHRLPRSAGGGHPDRQLRRLRLCRHDRVPDLHPGVGRGMVPAGNEWQAAANVIQFEPAIAI